MTNLGFKLEKTYKTFQGKIYASVHTSINEAINNKAKILGSN